MVPSTSLNPQSTASLIQCSPPAHPQHDLTSPLLRTQASAPLMTAGNIGTPEYLPPELCTVQHKIHAKFMGTDDDPRERLDVIKSARQFQETACTYAHA